MTCLHPRTAASAFRRLRLAAAIALLALAACGDRAGAPADTVAARSATPLQAEVDALVAKGPEAAIAELRPLDYWLHYKMLQSTGVEDALGGEANTVAALKALGEHYERRARGDQAALPKMIPAAFTGEGMSSGFLGLGLGSFGGLMSGGMLSGMVNDLSDERLSELVREGPLRVGGKEGHFEMQVGEDGSLSQNFEYEGKVDEGLTGKIKVKTKMEACPDASGKLTVTSDIDSSVKATGKAGTGGYVRSHFVLERFLDDDAHLKPMDKGGSTANMRLQMGGFENYEGQHMEMTRGWGSDGQETFDLAEHSGFSIFRLDEARRAGDLSRGALLIQTMMAEIMLRGIGSKQAPWETGRCVTLKPETTPGKRSGVKPSTSFQVTAAPRAKSDGAPTGGTVKATLTGGSSLTQDGAKVPADAQYTYVAPDQKDQTAGIAFEARSKRGVGRATLAFDTKQRQAYRVRGGQNDFRANVVVCSLGEPFDIKSTVGITMHMSGGLSGGSFTTTGQAAGVTWTGGGTYVVSLDLSEGSGSLKATGRSTILTPRGPFSDSVEPEFLLTPVDDACEDAP